MVSSTQATTLYPPSYTSQSEIGFYTGNQEQLPDQRQPPASAQLFRSLSPEDVRRMKYKIELDKQVAEKQQRRSLEWQKKIERDKKYVQHQPFGRHPGTTQVLNENELNEILSKGRAPSPVLDMPQQLIQHQQPQSYTETYMPNGGNASNPYYPPQPSHTETYMPNGGSASNPYYPPQPSPTIPYHPPQPSPRSSYHPQYSSYSIPQQQQQQQQQPPPPQQQQQSDPFSSSNRNGGDFHRFYGPNTGATGTSTYVTSTATSQPIKGDAHDPFLLFDPNKEGQNVFNIIPQQDMYDPWGRPGAGAPLIHAPTGQKFTRYSGSLQDKLNTSGPLGFYRREATEDIEEKKRELQQEQRRRMDDEMMYKSNVGNTADWINQLERNRYPLRLHLPTTETTREYIGARDRYRSDESRALHDDLIRQAEERARIHKLNRFNNSLADLQHTESMNSWWGKSGGGAPSFTNRRHNVANTFEHPRQKWTTNHLGQLVIADDQPTGEMKLATDYYYPKTKLPSNHRNHYQMNGNQA